MSQPVLNLIPRLVYSAESFVMHSGVVKIFEQFTPAVLAGRFSIYYIYGEIQSGKSHLSIALADHLQKQGRRVLEIHGLNLSSWLNQENGISQLETGSALIVDDADHYFYNLEGSGEFVNLVETMRVLKGTLVLLARTPMKDLPVDEHVMSRLIPGAGADLGSPAAEELPLILTAIAKQWGLKFSERKLKYITNRIGRNISDISHLMQNIWGAKGSERELLS